MTKDWDAVQDEIRELSFNQKRCLEDVKALMERKYKFRASTRAYRMKLKEWGLMRHKARGKTGTSRSMERAALCATARTTFIIRAAGPIGRPAAPYRRAHSPSPGECGAWRVFNDHA
ncbi:MAG: hypothetical protein M1823_008905, partial [Watsoniomyces obsoletus]